MVDFQQYTVSDSDMIDFGGRRKYPIIQWINQAQATKGTLIKGGFLFSSDQALPNGFEFSFQPEDVEILNGSTINGWYFRELNFSIMGRRIDWFYYSGTGRDAKKILGNSYDEILNAVGDRSKVRSRTQFLVMVKELAPWYGPVILTRTGKVGQSFDNMIKQECTDLVTSFGRAWNKKFPLWMFWMPIRTTDKAVLANSMHTGKVVYPMLVVPDNPDFKAMSRAAYIGDDLVESVRALLPEVRDWMAAKVVSQTHQENYDDDGPDWGAPAISRNDSRAPTENGDGGAQPVQNPFRRADIDGVSWD